MSHGPLSLVKKTKVLPSSPSRRSAPSTRPTLQSISSTTSPYRPRRLRPMKLPERKQRHVREGMGQIEEEGSVLVADDEFHRLLGIAAGKGRLIGGALDLLLVAIQRRRPPFGLLVETAGGTLRRGRRGVHVVGVRQTEVVVEAVPAGMMGRVVGVVAQVPLSQARRGIAFRLEGLGDGDFLGGQATGRIAP